MATKANHKTNRSEIRTFAQIVNVGPAIAADFELIGVATPQQLVGENPLRLYEKLLKTTGHFHDPCVLDVFMATVDYMNGNPPQTWWSFTSDRKRRYANQVAKLRELFSAPMQAN